MNFESIRSNISCVLLFSLVSGAFYAQDTIVKPKPSKTLKTQLKIPKSIVLGYEYDPVMDVFVYKKSVSGYVMGIPKILSKEDYYKLALKNNITEYYEKKNHLIVSKPTKEVREKQKNLIPTLYVNSDFFKSVFGGDEINFTPTGILDIDLGLRHTSFDNPSISPRLRSNTGLDINPGMNIGLKGSVGTRLNINFNYDTQSTFAFQNLIKVGYNADEDDIIQKIDFGNVNMAVDNSLISGAQRLFGLYTELQFGKTTVKGIFANQQSQTKTVTSQGGNVVRKFELTPLDYDDNRHFFLAHYFRDNYDTALLNYPFIDTQVQITRAEVWVTNRDQQTRNIRNIIAIQDLGETKPLNTKIGNDAPAGFFRSHNSYLPDNTTNGYDPTTIGTMSSVLDKNIRKIATSSQGFGILNNRVVEGSDYVKLENAIKLEDSKDYVLNSQLGYISLSQKLNDNEILAVAFQYTYRGEIYRVGEFSSGGNVTAKTNSEEDIAGKTLILKMLKSSITKVTDPVWDLMMKNIYNTGAYRVDKDAFKVNIFYNNPSPVNYLKPVDNSTWPSELSDRVLIDIFHMDRLDAYNNIRSHGDGIFDFVENITFDNRFGNIIFTTTEPFGEYIYNILGGGNYENKSTYNANQKKYVYRDLYRTTKAKAQQFSDQNKFLIKGRYKGETPSGRGGIPIGAFNVPKGSVKVTAGGRILREGMDYSVDYQGGTVQILNPTLQASNTPIQVSVEDGGIFGQQTKNFTGFDVQHMFNKNFKVGATMLNLNELPFTQKTNFGNEAVNNTIYGLNGIYSKELPFLTRLINKIPTVQSDIPSRLSVRGELAYLIPGSNKLTKLNGQTISYIDDFEAAQTLLNIKSPLGWSLASAPKGYGGERPNGDLSYGYKRAKLAWYTVDPMFYTGSRPQEINVDEISKRETRNVLVEELFPEKDVAQGQLLTQNTLDLVYYPEAKGPYNNNPVYESLNGRDKWAGIMRAFQSNNLEQSNIGYIQFWVMDPYFGGETTGRDRGEIVFNVGNISEDVLKDGKKQFENGLPDNQNTLPAIPTPWGKVPSTQSLNYTFDTNTSNRILQDVGIDGLNDAEERSIYNNNPGDDPALDNYEFYLKADGGILQRYYDYNGLEGNSPVEVSVNNRGLSGFPDTEDIDKNQTMNTIDTYYEYRIPIGPNMTITDKYVADIKEVNVKVPNGDNLNNRWILFKIPLDAPDDAIGDISDLRSVSNMRLYMTGFKESVVMRFGTLDLVRKDWRTYSYTLQDNDDPPEDDDTLFDLNTVNIQDNESGIPIPYVLPPGIKRQRFNTNNTIIRGNEQSLSLSVCQLEPKDARAVFKTVNYDFRRFKRLQMFVHAEAYKDNFVADNELVAFIRLGTDYTDNYYQAEIPLSITPSGSTTASEIWPDVNRIDIPLELLTGAKDIKIRSGKLSEITYFDENINIVNADAVRQSGKLRIAVKGNPSLGDISSMMIGIGNVTGEKICGEVWFDELRLADPENKGGWAAKGNIDLNIADFANISTSTQMNTVGFGTLEQKPNERSLKDNRQLSLYTNVNLGRLLPKKWGVQIPLGYNTSRYGSTPRYDQNYRDIKLKDRLRDLGKSEKKRIAEQSENINNRHSINLIGFRKNLGENQKSHFYNIENFTVNTSYNQSTRHNFELKNKKQQDIKAEAIYQYSFKPLIIAPLKNKTSTFVNSPYTKWLKDININLMPSNVMFSVNMDRKFEQLEFRKVFHPGDITGDTRSLPISQQRNYLYNWRYNITHNLTKSLQLVMNASSQRIVRNYYKKDDYGNTVMDEFGNPVVDYERDIFSGFFDTGDPNLFSSHFQVNYQLPLQKFPLLNFINLSYGYVGNFEWRRGSDIFKKMAREPINTIQNSQDSSFNLGTSMPNLYSTIGLTKIPDKGFGGVLKDILTMVKRINAGYTISRKTVLPGYTGSVGFLGGVDSYLGFVFGDQSDIRQSVAGKGLLTTYDKFNGLYNSFYSGRFSISVNAKPMDGLIIDIDAKRSQSENYKESFHIKQYGNHTFEYEKYTGNLTGDFSMSTILINTSFLKSDKETSKPFERFRANRKIIASRLALQDPYSRGLNDKGYPDGYNETHQSVVIPAFLAAYSGRDAHKINTSVFKNIPLPNWRLRYNGLTKFDWFKERFNRFSVSHGYAAQYSVRGYRTNIDYEVSNPSKKNDSGDFINPIIFEGVTLTERFSPLVRVDFELKSGLSVRGEIKKNRNLNLDLSSDLLSESYLKQYTGSIGYRFKDVRINIGKQRLSGDFNLKTDISYRDDINLIRNLKIDNSQIISGGNTWSAKFSADYSFARHIDFIFFYDHNFSSFKTSGAFPVTTIRSGLTFRYRF